MNLFGKRKTPKELLREYKRSIDRSCRDLDRERTKLQQQEKQTIAEIRKLADQGQMGAVQVMAKDLVRTRNYIQKFYKLRSTLQAVSLRLQTLQSNQAMADAMKGAAKAMKKMNNNLKLPQLQKIMMEFEKQSDTMDLKEGMMEDTMDDVLGDDDADVDAEAVVNQVLDELNINLSGQMPAPSARAAQGTKDETSADADLQARFENLRQS
eukprot:c10204_g2_i1.p1 GENE.c10204_g2_i1~~c10204_g2_i1.p1  ORF type:complete len:230 (+),score=70.09 c10204_g2_i1:63-692(+)